jgi:membrane fusion protein, multidrug efflux system
LPWEVEITTFPVEEEGERLSPLDRAGGVKEEATLVSLQLGVPLELRQTSDRVKGAQAQVESMRKTMDKVLREEEAARQELKRAEAQHDLSLLEVKRMRELSKTRSVVQSLIDAAETATQTNSALVGAANARVESIRKQPTERGSNRS